MPVTSSGRAARAVRLFLWPVLVAALGLGLASPAAAGPPANDNRADATVVPAVPADFHGTVAEATMERLDPQESRCGSIASTVWYRVDVAPDGTVTAALKAAAGTAPVLRLYRLGRSRIEELDCAVAAPGGVATASFKTVRGAGYLILVGRRPTSVDGEFDLHIELALPPDPPANDRQARARRIRAFPATIKGTTIGARAEETDPKGCGMAESTVWYRLSPARTGLLVVRLQTARRLDAVLAVAERRGSSLRVVGCRPTNDGGRAAGAFAGRKGVQYLVAVGHRAGQDPGAFTLTLVAAVPPERLPGRTLSAAGARGQLHGLTNVNDIWRVAMKPGTSYRIAFASRGGASLELRSPKRDGVLVRLSGGGYHVFTPGRDGGGRYVLEVRAAPLDASQSYRLHVRAVEPDDVGVGLLLENRKPRRGSLAPRGVDVVDIYHFHVEQQANVQVSLATSSGRAFRLSLVSDEGGTLAAGDVVRRQLAPGRYIAAVTAPPGTAGGSYRLTLLVRDLTSTTLALGATSVPLGSTIVLRPQVTPASTGLVEIQIDRFDPLGGWQFHRIMRVAVGGSVSWRPPSEGHWRVRAAFRGSTTASPSRSEYIRLHVD
jgi:hypothetical protein